MITFLTGWRGKRLHSNSLVVGINTLGELPPLFWCVQGQEELVILSEALGENQPIYGMRSLSNISGKNQSHTKPLAKQYARELLELKPEGDFNLGGFCEGGSFIFEVAMELQNKGRHISLLCLHDRFVENKYSGRVVFFFCQDSMSSLYLFIFVLELVWY